MEWKPIATVPKDGTEVLIGHWFDDTANGYFGASRWFWITAASYEDGECYILFEDEPYPEDHMRNYREATHWAPWPEAPQ